MRMRGCHPPRPTYPLQWAGPSTACEDVRRPGDAEVMYETTIWWLSRLKIQNWSLLLLVYFHNQQEGSRGEVLCF